MLNLSIALFIVLFECLLISIALGLSARQFVNPFRGAALQTSADGDQLRALADQLVRNHQQWMDRRGEIHAAVDTHVFENAEQKAALQTACEMAERDLHAAATGLMEGGVIDPTTAQVLLARNESLTTALHLLATQTTIVGPAMDVSSKQAEETEEADEPPSEETEEEASIDKNLLAADELLEASKATLDETDEAARAETEAIEPPQPDLDDETPKTPPDEPQPTTED